MALVWVLYAFVELFLYLPLLSGAFHHGLFAYRDRPTLKKPFQIDGLKGMLQGALDSGSP